MTTRDFHTSHIDSISDYLTRGQGASKPNADLYSAFDGVKKPDTAPAKTKKRMISSKDREDKTMDLERENNALKEKENLL